MSIISFAITCIRNPRQICLWDRAVQAVSPELLWIQGVEFVCVCAQFQFLFSSSQIF